MEKKFKTLVYEGKYVDLNKLIGALKIVPAEIPMVFHKDKTIAGMTMEMELVMKANKVPDELIKVREELIKKCSLIEVTLTIPKPKKK